MNDLTTETLRRLLKETQARIAELEKERDDWKGMANKLDAKCSHEQGEGWKLLERTRELSAQLAAAQARIAELERELANGWQARSLANAQAADNWRNEAAQLSDKLAELEQEREHLLAELKASDSLSKGDLSLIMDDTNIIASLKQQLAAATKDAEVAREKRDAANRRFSGLASAVSDWIDTDSAAGDACECNGTGLVDSGGVDPSGNYISTPCPRCSSPTLTAFTRACTKLISVEAALAAAESRATTAELLADRYRAALISAREELKRQRLCWTWDDHNSFALSAIDQELLRIDAALASPARTSEPAKQGLSEQIAGAENAAADGEVWGGAEL